MATRDDVRAGHWSMLRFLESNALLGVAIGFAICFALLGFDTGGIASRIAHAENRILPLSLTFGGAAAASAIMLPPYRRKFRNDPEA